MFLILAHLGEEQRIELQSDSTSSEGPSNSALPLEVEKVKIQLLHMKLEHER